MRRFSLAKESGIKPEPIAEMAGGNGPIDCPWEIATVALRKIQSGDYAWPALQQRHPQLHPRGKGSAQKLSGHSVVKEQSAKWQRSKTMDLMNNWIL